MISFGTGGLHVAHEQEARQQLAFLVDERKIFLVLLHADDEAFPGNLEEGLVEAARQHHRMLDQAGHFVHQLIGLAQAPAGAGTQLFRGGIQPFGNDFTACAEGSDDFARLLQDFFVIVGPPDRDQALAEKAVAAGFVAALEPEHRARHHLVSVQQDHAVHRAHELRLAVAPAHDLGDRQFLERGFDNRGQM